MKKSDLIDALSSATDLNKAQVDMVLNALPDVVLAGLKGAGAVTLPGIGKIEAKHRAAREMRNPATGGIVMKEATTVPGFKPVKGFKDAVADIKTG